MPVNTAAVPTLNEEKLKHMEQFIRLWGKLTQEDALALIVAYRADVHAALAALPSNQ